jgi:predicted alpha/beta superfamily hydrolase
MDHPAASLTVFLNSPTMLKAVLQKVTLTLLLTNLVQKTIAQDTLLTVTYKGKLDSLNSAILSQKRYIQVFVPADYKPGSTEKYDVLYVTDGGNWNISLVTQLQRFIQNEGHMPPTIIVSIMGIDRNIELTPTALKTWNAPTGGADKFLVYIKNELIPYINKTYPSNGDNSLWGHSLGGMFVTYVMLQEPGLFKSYIAADPSYWWDNSYVPKMAAEKLPNLSSTPLTLFITGREGIPFHEMRIDTMEIILKKFAPANLKWKLVTYAGETHSSLRLKTIYEGLRYSYEGFTSNIEFLPMNGIVLKDKPYKITCLDDTTRLHYTIDGTSPTEQSPQVTREITVTGPAKVTYKRLSNRSRYDKSVTGDFTTETLTPPVSKPSKARPGGFHYTYYEGDGDKQPDLKTAKALKAGILDSTFKADVLPRKNKYCLVLDGLLEAKEEGYYTFFVRAGKGSRVWIDGKLIMQWDDNDKHEFFAYLLPLSKGFYPIKIESYDKKEDYSLLLYYLTPGMPASGDPIPLPFEREYGINKN